MIYHARTVTQFEQSEILVDTETGVSAQPYVSTATSVGRLIRRETAALLYSDFGYSGTASSVVLDLHVSRLGRTQDKVIQLYYNGGLQGSNLADLSAGDRHQYVFEGSYTVDSSFGIVIDLQPHVDYPSSNTVYIRSVAVQFVQ